MNWIFTMQTPVDLRGRAVSQLVFAISQLPFKENIYIHSVKEDRQAKASSILGVLSLGIQEGDILEILGAKTEEELTEISDLVWLTLSENRDIM